MIPLIDARCDQLHYILVIEVMIFFIIDGIFCLCWLKVSESDWQFSQHSTALNDADYFKFPGPFLTSSSERLGSSLAAMLSQKTGSVQSILQRFATSIILPYSTSLLAVLIKHLLSHSFQDLPIW